MDLEEKEKICSVTYW